MYKKLEELQRCMIGNENTGQSDIRILGREWRRLSPDNIAGFADVL